MGALNSRTASSDLNHQSISILFAPCLRVQSPMKCCLFRPPDHSIAMQRPFQQWSILLGIGAGVSSPSGMCLLTAQPSRSNSLIRPDT